MQRTKFQTNAQEIDVNLQSRLLVLSTIANRYGLAQRMSGQTYNGARDMYSALGYPKQLSWEDYYSRYVCQDLASAVINRPVNKAWRGDTMIQETREAQDTDLEKAWADLWDDLKLKDAFVRLDKLTGIGRYGILLLGFNDTQDLNQYAQPVSKTSDLKLVYLKPLSEASATVNEWETEPSNSRYGLPKAYNIQTSNTSLQPTSMLVVHYSRVIHVVDAILESEVEGIPRLQPIFNRLIDAEKIVGGDAEMFWRGARGGFNAKVDKDFTLTDPMRKKLEEQIDEYENYLRRFLVSQGISYEQLASQLATDPDKHLSIIIQMVSAQTHIPARVLLGNEQGMRAGDQDSDEYNEYIQSRREDFCELRILRPFVTKMVELGILPAPVNKKYTFKWDDIFAASDKEKTEVGKNRAAALKDYASAIGGSDIIPEDAFMELFLGLKPEEIELVNEMRKTAMSEEKPLTPAEQAALKQQKEIEKQPTA